MCPIRVTFYLNVCWQALITLFVLASRDGWVNIMYTGLDAVGLDQQVSFYVLEAVYYNVVQKLPI